MDHAAARAERLNWLARVAGRSRRAVFGVLAAAALVVPTGVVAATPAAAVTCGQPSTAFWATPGGTLANGSTVTVAVGQVAFMTGIVPPGTGVTYSGANLASTVTTTAADGNCVVHHQDNPVIIGNPRGTWPIFASYTRWEDGVRVTSRLVGFVHVV